MSVLSVLCALSLSFFVRWQLPWPAFNRWAGYWEQRFNAAPGRAWRSHGVSAWLITAVPILLLSYALILVPYLGWWVEVILLWWMLDLAAISQRITVIAQALRLGDNARAKRLLAPLAKQELEDRELAKTSIELLLRLGGHVLAVLFWFVLLGALGAVLYRLSERLNTLWGQRDLRFIRFGWASAQLFRGLDYMPARLAALTYAVLGHTGQALYSWRHHAKQWPSSNAGALIASGGGALDVRLGGPAHYQGFSEPRTVLGGSRPASASLLEQTLNLIYVSVGVWVLCLALGTWLSL